MRASRRRRDQVRPDEAARAAEVGDAPDLHKKGRRSPTLAQGGTITVLTAAHSRHYGWAYDISSNQNP